MVRLKNRFVCLSRPAFRVALCCGAVLATAASLPAALDWSSGAHTVNPGENVQDNTITLGAGPVTIHGAEGGASGGVLQLNAGGSGLSLTGSLLLLNADPSQSGLVLLKGNVTNNNTSSIASSGPGAVPGSVSLNGGTRTINLASGELAISALIANGGLTKTGPAILALSGPNTFTGGITLNAGTIYINSAAAIGTGNFTVGGPGTAIDNTSGAPITLANNNQFNLSGGDLSFLGSNDLNLGTGSFVMSGASARTINVANTAATLTIGGIISDNGGGVALTKNGPGTLVFGTPSVPGESNIYTGGTTVAAGTLRISAGAETGPGPVAVSAGATLSNNGTVNGNLSVSGTVTGAGTVNGSLVVNAGGTVDVNGGTFTVNGGVTNNGLFILSNGAQIAGVTGFVNNGTLDLITAGTFNPPNFTNNGTIINSSAVKTKSVSRAGGNFSVTIDSYTGHTYQLQKSASPVANTFSNIGSSQQGTTGTVLTLTDSSATASPSFYSILVSP